MPKPDKNGASNGLILGNEVLQKCSNFFPGRFLKKKFAELLWHGSLVLYMPKPDKKDASNGLILGHKVLQKCSNFFQEDFELGLDPKIELEEGWIPRYHQTVFWGAQGIRTAA